MEADQNVVVVDDSKVKDEESNIAAPVAKAEAIEHGEQDLLHEENVDAVLTAKMVLVNDVSPEKYPWPTP